MSNDYRLYLLNDSGHIVDAVNLECRSDREAAFIAARQGVVSHRVV